MLWKKCEKRKYSIQIPKILFKLHPSPPFLPLSSPLKAILLLIESYSFCQIAIQFQYYSATHNFNSLYWIGRVGPIYSANLLYATSFSIYFLHEFKYSKLFVIYWTFLLLCLFLFPTINLSKIDLALFSFKGLSTWSTIIYFCHHLILNTFNWSNKI